MIVLRNLSKGGPGGGTPFRSLAKQVYTNTIEKKDFRTFKNYWRSVSSKGTVVAETLERLHSVLTGGSARTPVKRTHDLFCDCRKCEPSINSFWRYMRKELVWDDDNHLI